MIIVFAGTPEFAVPSLQDLAAGPHRVAAVYTRADRRAGRGRRPVASPVKAAALDLGIPVEQPECFRAKSTLDRLAAYRPDLVVVAAYGLILPPEVLALPQAGCINVHASLLPRWRGAAPVQHAILAGDSETGASIMQMDEGIDTGGILLSRSCRIGPQDDAGSLTRRIGRIGAQALAEVTAGIASGRLAPRPQDDAAATLAPRIRKSDALIDWTLDAPYLERLVRAFDPWPVAFTHAGDEALRVLRAEVVPVPDRAPHPPGTVVHAGPAGIDVQAGDGQLRVLRLQRPGKRPMDAREFLPGPGPRAGGSG